MKRNYICGMKVEIMEHTRTVRVHSSLHHFLSVVQTVATYPTKRPSILHVIPRFLLVNFDCEEGDGEEDEAGMVSK